MGTSFSLQFQHDACFLLSHLSCKRTLRFSNAAPGAEHSSTEPPAILHLLKCREIPTRSYIIHRIHGDYRWKIAGSRSFLFQLRVWVLWRIGWDCFSSFGLLQESRGFVFLVNLLDIHFLVVKPCCIVTVQSAPSSTIQTQWSLSPVNVRTMAKQVVDSCLAARSQGGFITYGVAHVIRVFARSNLVSRASGEFFSTNQSIHWCRRVCSGRGSSEQKHDPS